MKLPFSSKTGFKADFIKMLAANLINSGSVFASTLLLMRIFNQESFAWIGSGLAYAFVIAKVLDSGLSFTTLRFAAKQDESLKSRPYLGILYLEIFVMAALLLFFGQLPAGEFCIRWMFGWDDPQLFNLAILTAGAIALGIALRTDLQVNRQYGKILTLHLALSIIRLSCIGLMWYDILPQLEAYGFMVLYLIPILLTSILYAPRIAGGVSSALSKGKGIASLLREMVCYAPWVWLAGSLFVLAIRAPVIVLGHLELTSQVAMYAAVLSFISVVSLVNDAARAVIVPRSVKFFRKEDFRDYIGRVDKLFFRAFLSMTVVVVGSSFAVALLLPDEYLPESCFAFLVLATALLTTTILGAFTTLIHAIGRPQVETFANGIRALLVLGGSYLIGSETGGGVVAQAAFTGLILVVGEFVLTAYVRRYVGNLRT